MTAIYQLHEVAFDYGTGFALAHVNLEIESATITSFVGPNGSGKTSLLNLLAFLNIPTSGTLKFQGQSLQSGRQNVFKKSVGYVQQNPYLLRGSVLYNVELGLKLKHIEKTQRRQRADEVLQLMNITELQNRSIHDLSGGEAQKVAIAQVLVLEPEVLILDEPFTFLDKNSINELETLIQKLQNDFRKTIVLTTHNQLQAQALSDKVYSIVQGKVFESQIMNMFNGKLDKNGIRFDTGKQIFILPEGAKETGQVAIDPRQIVISKHRLDSSMQNCFNGRITAMVELNGQVKLTVFAGEEFHVIITHQALEEMALSIGNEAWISFKSSSILIC